MRLNDNRARILLAIPDSGEISSLDIWNATKICALATMFVELDELEAMGIIEKRYVPGGPERGYRHKALYKFTQAGLEALEEYRNGK